MRRETHFLEDELAPVNSTTVQTSCLIHVPPLPRTPARGFCTLVSSCSVSAESEYTHQSYERCLFSLTSYMFCPTAHIGLATCVWWITL